MRIPAPIVAVGALALILVVGLFLFMLLAAVRLVFAFAELLGGLLLFGVIAFVVWKVFLEPDNTDTRGGV